jgi:hypothetical protein
MHLRKVSITIQSFDSFMLLDDEVLAVYPPTIHLRNSATSAGATRVACR